MLERASAGRELGWFFALALGAAAVLHGSIALLGLRFSLSAESPALSLYLLGLASPTAAALVLSGSTGRWHFLRCALRVRGAASVYVLALVAQPCVLALAWLLSHSGNAAAPLRLSASSGLGILAVGQLWVVLGEELGWRGFALPRLERLLSPRSATLALALGWGVWHVPMFFVPGSLQAGEHAWEFAAAIFAWSCVHSLLYSRARPSVVPNLVFHACANVTLNLVEVPADSRGALTAAYLLAGSGAWLLLGRTRSVEPTGNP
ncbi:MAG TPA: CPBP family intramembrane glutamic endopeptidase [Myxococcota bacterium]|nr:CPBP family intramembrane glutamic endopeptidase [Myxococcota bacterium]